MRNEVLSTLSSKKRLDKDAGLSFDERILKAKREVPEVHLNSYHLRKAFKERKVKRKVIKKVYM